MNIKEAKQICRRFGYEVNTGKYCLSGNPDEGGYPIMLNSDAELIKYAQDLLKGEGD